MMKKKRYNVPFSLLLVILTFASITVSAGNDGDSIMEFTEIAVVAGTPVKNQNKSGTCWSFAATSFLESEVLRKTGKTVDLSEMYFVRYAYPSKAYRYVRMHGNTSFSPGGQAHDVMDVISSRGLITEEAYSGLHELDSKHIHGEMDAMLHAMLQSVIRKKNAEAPLIWPLAISNVLDAYLGVIPESMNYGKKSMTPLELRDELKIDANDYVEITSFTHHPFYSSFALEVPDNWSYGIYYNVPMEELMFIIENSLRNDYSVVWDGDVGHKGFQYKKGTATVPVDDEEEIEEEEDDMTIKIDAEVVGACKPEEYITQEYRQEMFDKLISTDDHLMHITGLVEGPSGKYYFKTKNSWAETSNDYKGYVYMTEAYLKLNTIAIMVHKDAIPRDIAKKLGLK